MTCEEALHNLATYLDEELDPASRERVDEHLKICRACYSRLEFETALKQRLAETRCAKAPAELEARVRALLRRY